MALASLGLAFGAGMLSTLSPCVLPLLPLVLGAALSQHRFGPMALAAGLSISFSAVGIFLAVVGFAIGLDDVMFRMVAASLMIALGVILLVPRFEMGFALAAGPVGNWAEQRFGSSVGIGLGGQFGVGLLLGAVWSPCVGPTLGAASLMASQGQNLGQVAATMFLFGIGTTVPLLLLSLLSRATLGRWHGRFAATGKNGKRAFGTLLITFGLLALTGLDRTLQSALGTLVPEWLTNLAISI